MCKNMYDHINCLAAEVKVFPSIISTCQNAEPVNRSNSGSPVPGQRRLSITAQQPQGTAGITAISFPATLGSAGPQTGFPSSLAHNTR